MSNATGRERSRKRPYAVLVDGAAVGAHSTWKRVQAHALEQVRTFGVARVRIAAPGGRRYRRELVGASWQWRLVVAPEPAVPAPAPQLDPDQGFPLRSAGDAGGEP